ncbi:MAG TPA: hypothetical protein VMC62_05800 [Longilinea sp.]|nr:hypothetical protein [Longilinea sp.]
MLLSPLYVPVPARDSGIFLYIGSEILHGKVLYLQTWDNKQPLLYLFNAVGLWLGNGSTWGVWALEAALFVVALVLMYAILRRSLAPFASFAVSIASFLAVFPVLGGNYSEEYAIVFQVSILALLFLAYLPNRHRLSRPLSALGMGLATGLVFCLKQTYLDVGIAVVFLIAFLSWLEKDVKRLFHLLWMLLGFVLVNALVVLYFYSHGALNDYIVSAFLFNRYYSSQGLLEWLHTVLKVIEFNSGYPFLFIMGSLWLGGVLFVLVKGWPLAKKLSRHPLTKWIALLLGVFCLGLFAYGALRGGSSGIGLLQGAVLALGILFLVLAAMLFARWPRATTDGSWENTTLRQKLSEIEWGQTSAATFLFLGIIDLPIVMLTISLSGMNFNHYFISLLIPVFLLSSAAMIWLDAFLRSSPHKVLLTCILVSVFLAGSYAPLLQIGLKLPLKVDDSQDPRARAAAYLKSVTMSQDTILQWGWESGIYFLADRQAPTRYSFQFPAYFNSPYRQAVLTTILTDIEADPPLYIADTEDDSMPFIQGMNKAECLAANPADGNGLQPILNYVCSNYEFVKRFGDIDIYKRVQ